LLSKGSIVIEGPWGELSLKGAEIVSQDVNGNETIVAREPVISIDGTTDFTDASGGPPSWRATGGNLTVKGQASLNIYCSDYYSIATARFSGQIQNPSLLEEAVGIFGPYNVVLSALFVSITLTVLYSFGRRRLHWHG
jgi:hypothetical protein